MSAEASPAGSLFARLKAAAAPAWAEYVGHPFVEGMADGTLPEAAFRHYLVQDYLFLIHFARAYALAAYKGTSLAEIRAGAAGLSNIVDNEMGLHVKLCASWGLSPEDLEAAPEARATMAYTRFVLETGLRGDLLDLHVALAPCMVGYAEIASALAARPGALSPENPYAVWIGEYASDGYQSVTVAAIDNLDRLAGEVMTERRFPKLARIFEEATRLEADFWQMGLTLAV
ncbi:MAG: thiaminase II [Hyphomicrobiales bacterium]